MHYYLDPTFKASLPQEQDVFHYLLNLEGDRVYRALENRRTQSFVQAGRIYYIKQHYGIGWREIFKNLLQGKLPILGANSEYLALKKLALLNIPAPRVLAFGKTGWNPATQKSFIVTAALEGFESLEYMDFSALTPSKRRQLIQQMAEISRKIHEAGINHRDFYLCHFWKKGDELCVIDWHRAQCRQHVPPRWRLKDLSGLYFSCLDLTLSRKDFYRFLKTYFQQALRKIFQDHQSLLKNIDRKARQLSQKEDQK